MSTFPAAQSHLILGLHPLLSGGKETFAQGFLQYFSGGREVGQDQAASLCRASSGAVPETGHSKIQGQAPLQAQRLQG